MTTEKESTAFDVTKDTTTVRSKFFCNTKTQRRDGNRFLYDYEFGAVTSGSEENKDFFAWTPSGNLKISSVTDGQFIPGQEYYLDITYAPPQATK